MVECARKIVTDGPQSALPDVPIEKVGAWQSADRREIEGVRSVGNAIQEYLQEKNPKTPLCLAVFGPPGAGKSFALWKRGAWGWEVSVVSLLTCLSLHRPMNFQPPPDRPAAARTDAPRFLG